MEDHIRLSRHMLRLLLLKPKIVSKAFFSPTIYRVLTLSVYCGPIGNHHPLSCWKLGQTDVYTCSLSTTIQLEASITFKRRYYYSTDHYPHINPDGLVLRIAPQIQSARPT